MMKAGTYYIGDLCYVMHKEWDEFCELTINGTECLSGEFRLKDGRAFATYKTLYGDGTYRSDIGTYHPVDAGLIGCIRVEDITEDLTEAEIEQHGAIVEFLDDFETGSDAQGNIFFGFVGIATGDYYDEEDDEGEYDDE